MLKMLIIFLSFLFCIFVIDFQAHETNQDKNADRILTERDTLTYIQRANRDLYEKHNNPKNNP